MRLSKLIEEARIISETKEGQINPFVTRILVEGESLEEE